MRAIACLAGVAATAWLAPAHAQTVLPGQTPACLAGAEMKAEQLHGHWLARFTGAPAGLPDRAMLELRRHAEFSESLAGTVSRTLPPGAIGSTAARAALAGDLDDGLLLLDESSDNIAVTGTWNGEMQPGSCGRIYQGVWTDTSTSAAPGAPGLPFTLTRLP